MAPRTRAKKLAADQTYTSKPALAQKRFPNRRKTVTTDGLTRQVLDKRQSTLTQIDFGGLSGREKIDDSEEDEFEEEEPPRKRRKASGRAGDEGGNKSRRKSAMTQTLTQMDFVRSRRVEDSEDEGLLSDEEELAPHPGTNDLDLQSDAIKASEIADSTRSVATIEVSDAVGDTKSREGSREQDAAPRDEASHTCGGAMLPPRLPQTPKRVRILAVPSSQTPPTTPLSTQQSPRHLRSGKDRSPLQERSTNIPILTEPIEDVLEPTKPNSPILNINSISKDRELIKSPTKQRAREFRARMDELRNGGALRQTRRKAGPLERNQVIRSSTEVSLVSDEGENESRDKPPKTGETQFAIGEETQAILGGIDLTCDIAHDTDHNSEPEAMEEEEEHEDQDSNTGCHVDEDEDENPIFDIGEPQEPLEVESVEVPDLTVVAETETLNPRDVHPRESSPELPFDIYDEEERVPSSQNETPRGTRLIHHESTTQGRRVTFSNQLTLPIPQSPASTAPPEEGLDTQGSVDAASAQLLYESQAYAALAASSPIEAQPMPISSPVPAPLSSQDRSFRTPNLPQKATQAPIEEETQAPSTGRTESLSTTSGTYPKSILRSGRSQVRTHSSPPPQPEIRSSPTTPGMVRFLRGPITVSQLIPDSLRSDLYDSIGLPPRWTQEDDEDDDEL